jgi:hypothetical protein
MPKYNLVLGVHDLLSLSPSSSLLKLSGSNFVDGSLKYLTPTSCVSSQLAPLSVERCKITDTGLVALELITSFLGKIRTDCPQNRRRVSYIIVNGEWNDIEMVVLVPRNVFLFTQ